MNITDFIPHGMITAFAGIAAYVYKDHVKQDDNRFGKICADLDSVAARQTQISDMMATNHAEILKVLLAAEQQRALNKSLVNHGK